MRRAHLLVAFLLVSLAAMGPASGATSVAITEATVTGTTATVKGTAAFPAITTPETVIGEEATHTPFGVAPLADAAGANLLDARIVPISGGLRFIWVVNNLPEQIAPEIVRWTWSFKIGETQFQLQAKRTNLASVTTTEDPVGHVQQAAAQKNFFQLRGACTTSYQGLPSSGCFHLAWLNGSFDSANKQVTMDLPYETRDQIGRIVAPQFKPGVILEEQQTAGSSITANFQAVVSTTDTSDYFNGWSSYFVGGRVQLGVANHTASPDAVTYGAPVSINPDGTFQSTLSGISASANTVFARACNGRTCEYASQRVA